MRRNFYCIGLFLVLTGIFLPLCAFADSAYTVLESSRSLKPVDAIALLEKNLASSGILRPYFISDLARHYGETGNWAKVVTLCTGLESLSIPDDLADQTAWWHSLALERQGHASDAAAVARNRISGGHVADPSVYLIWFRNAVSGTQAMIESFDKTFPELKNTDPQTFALSRYLSGLCAVREGEWSCAERSLSRFTQADEKRFPDLAPWCRYYRAYSLYRLGRWNDALAGFSAYLDTWPNHACSWQAATAATLAALQSNSDALPFADRAVKLAPSIADRASSNLLRASILFDRKKYLDAESILSGIADGSTTNGLTVSAPRALFMLAEISVRLKHPDEAESRWLSFGLRFPSDPLAEEALYRAAEMRYLDGAWGRASELFTQYRQKWPSGRFLDTVLRSGGDAYKQNGSADLAILWWEDLAKKYPESPAVPRTLADLVDAYRLKGEYDNALATAQKYRARYPSESKADGIDQTIADLTVLKKGGTAGTAALVADWEKNDRSKTAEGRAAGVALARKYLADYGTRAEAKKILREITAKSPQKIDLVSSGERSVFAAAWSLYGSMCRNDADFTTASRALLAAGNWYAAIDGERSAESLYGAVDCFLQAGLRGDAEKTVETLASTWPDSVWTKRAKILMEQ